MGQIRIGLTVAGAVILMIGLLWVGHGQGYYTLPGAGFITRSSVWTVNGSLVAAFGALVLLASRRLLRDADGRAS